MSLELRWDLRVPVGLRSLSQAERRRVTETILSLADDPMPSAARSLPGKPQWFRLDDGPFCILYALDATDSVVTVYVVSKDGRPLGGEEL